MVGVTRSPPLLFRLGRLDIAVFPQVWSIVCINPGGVVVHSQGRLPPLEWDTPTINLRSDGANRTPYQ